eukprot:1161676-Pelagomonas_calceolata.AAC.10
MHMGAHDLVHKFPAMAKQMLRMHIMPYAYSVEELTAEGKGLQENPDRLRPGHKVGKAAAEDAPHAFCFKLQRGRIDNRGQGAAGKSWLLALRPLGGHPKKLRCYSMNAECIYLIA